MLVVILAYDQLLFRPLVAWSAKFRFETTAGATASDPWMLRLIRRTRLFSFLGDSIGRAASSLGGLRLSFAKSPWVPRETHSRAINVVWMLLISALIGWACWRAFTFAAAELTWADLGEALLLGLVTLSRVIILLDTGELVWVPIGFGLDCAQPGRGARNLLHNFSPRFRQICFSRYSLSSLFISNLTATSWLTPLMDPWNSVVYSVQRRGRRRGISGRFAGSRQ